MDKDMEVRRALWEKQAGMEVQLEAWQEPDNGNSYILWDGGGGDRALFELECVCGVQERGETKQGKKQEWKGWIQEKFRKESQGYPTNGLLLILSTQHVPGIVLKALDIYLNE